MNPVGNTWIEISFVCKRQILSKSELPTFFAKKTSIYIYIYWDVPKKRYVFFFTKTWKYRRTCLNKNSVQSTARNFNFKRFLIVPKVFPFNPFRGGGTIMYHPFCLSIFYISDRFWHFIYANIYLLGSKKSELL